MRRGTAYTSIEPHGPSERLLVTRSPPPPSFVPETRRAVRDRSRRMSTGSPDRRKTAFDNCESTLACPGEGDSREPLAQANRVFVPGAYLGAALFVGAACVGAQSEECPPGKGDANGYAAVINVYASDI